MCNYCLLQQGALPSRTISCYPHTNRNYSYQNLGHFISEPNYIVHIARDPEYSLLQR